MAAIAADDMLFVLPGMPISYLCDFVCLSQKLIPKWTFLSALQLYWVRAAGMGCPCWVSCHKGQGGLILFAGVQLWQVLGERNIDVGVHMHLWVTAIHAPFVCCTMQQCTVEGVILQSVTNARYCYTMALVTSSHVLVYCSCLPYPAVLLEQACLQALA